MKSRPPSDVSAPPSSRNGSNFSLFRLVGWIVGLLLVGWVVADVTTFVSRQRVKADQTSAVSDSRQLGMSLFEFEREFGRFPDASTIAAVKAKSGSLLPLGTKTTNDYFRQLIASGILQSEQTFYAKIPGTRYPDGRMDPAHAIEKGECGYSYLMGLSSKGNPSRPLLVTPLIPGTDRFDPKPFGGKSVLLKLDNSVTSAPIGADGHVLVNGQKVFDPTHPIWDAKPPVIVWPDL